MNTNNTKNSSLINAVIMHCHLRNNIVEVENVEMYRHKLSQDKNDYHYLVGFNFINDECKYLINNDGSFGCLHMYNAVFEPRYLIKLKEKQIHQLAFDDVYVRACGYENMAIAIDEIVQRLNRNLQEMNQYAG